MIDRRPGRDWMRIVSCAALVHADIILLHANGDLANTDMAVETATVFPPEGFHGENEAKGLTESFLVTSREYRHRLNTFSTGAPAESRDNEDSCTSTSMW